jgi:hypothetical protein
MKATYRFPCPHSLVASRGARPTHLPAPSCRSALTAPPSSARRSPADGGSRWGASGLAITRRRRRPPASPIHGKKFPAGIPAETRSERRLQGRLRNRVPAPWELIDAAVERQGKRRELLARCERPGDVRKSAHPMEAWAAAAARARSAVLNIPVGGCPQFWGKASGDGIRGTARGRQPRDRVSIEIVYQETDNEAIIS